MEENEQQQKDTEQSGQSETRAAILFCGATYSSCALLFFVGYSFRSTEVRLNGYLRGVWLHALPFHEPVNGRLLLSNAVNLQE
jgi:hypothetical protein